MTDPRIKDSIRNTEAVIVSLSERLDDIVKTLDIVKKDIKDMKRSTVRKYRKNG